VTIPQDAQVIDAHGKYVIPGLADMHQHSQDRYRPEFDRAEDNLR
jgi:imidazolonepropionase-like amidohydrolase